MKKKESLSPHFLSWKYYTVIGATFFLGLTVMLVSQIIDNEAVWVHFFGEIGAFIAAAISSHFIYDRLIRKDQEKFIIQELKTAIEQKIANAQFDSGIVTSKRKLNVAEFNRMAVLAQQRIWILQTWLGNFISLETAIKIALQKKIAVEILILNPSSRFCLNRGVDLGVEHPDYVPNNINANLLRLEGICKEFNYPINFIVKVYDGTAPLIIHGIDDNISLGFTWRNKHTTDSPQLQLKLKDDGGYYFSEYVKNHFNSVWNSATTVDFKEKDWFVKLKINLNS